MRDSSRDASGFEREELLGEGWDTVSLNASDELSLNAVGEDVDDREVRCSPNMVASDGYCLVCGEMTYHSELD